MHVTQDPADKAPATVPADPNPRVQAVLKSAGRAGLLRDKTARIAGRISPELLALAKARTGLASDTELLEFALASLALEDPFVATFRELRSTVDPSLQLGY